MSEARPCGPDAGGGSLRHDDSLKIRLYDPPFSLSTSGRWPLREAILSEIPWRFSSYICCSLSLPIIFHIICYLLVLAPHKENRPVVASFNLIGLCLSIGFLLSLHLSLSGSVIMA